MKHLEVQVFEAQSQHKDGKSVLLAAGDEQLYQACKTVFDALSSKSFFLGETAGKASKMNIVLETIASLKAASVAESLNLGNLGLY